MTVERVRPARKIPKKRIHGIATNASLLVVASLIMRLAPALLAFNVALYADKNSLGLINAFAANERFQALFFIVSIVFLDAAIYFQHRIFHKIPALWRLHRVHHSDLHIDASSALRFHPIEIMLSMLFKSLLVLIFGISPAAIIAFEIILNACALFSHTNIDLGPRTDAIIRSLFVTPTMHRIHHSELRKDCDSNFGFCLSIWDRLFGSYTSTSRSNRVIFRLGVRHIPGHDTRKLIRLLTQPFKRYSNPKSR